MKYAELPSDKPHAVPSGKPTMTAISWILNWNQLEAEESESMDD